MARRWVVASWPRAQEFAAATTPVAALHDGEERPGRVHWGRCVAVKAVVHLAVAVVVWRGRRRGDGGFELQAHLCHGEHALWRGVK
jgi:hypothetical protein